MIRNSIPRLRSVRFKDGRAPLRIIRPSPDRESEHLESFISSSQDIAATRANTMAGYVIVAWAKDGGTSTQCRTGGLPIPILMLPEFVKACVEDWVYGGPE